MNEKPSEVPGGSPPRSTRPPEATCRPRPRPRQPQLTLVCPLTPASPNTAPQPPPAGLSWNLFQPNDL